MNTGSVVVLTILRVLVMLCGLWTHLSWWRAAQFCWWLCCHTLPSAGWYTLLHIQGAPQERYKWLLLIKTLAPAPASCSVPYRTGSWPHVAQRGANWPSVMWLHVSEVMTLFCLTTMLLYIFCCSSLRESFTLPLFSPPSLQETRIKSRTNYHNIYEKNYIKASAGFVWGCSVLFVFLGLFYCLCKAPNLCFDKISLFPVLLLKEHSSKCGL